ncbi:juvenile hormone esterase-like [Achroia grisella]|uniref:juvenile hormone esterase-like n=1 Tax=Achroia grisella TaxID=688607 RepID=UPI0027D2ACAC|nr:juvenile hormone esterase-like [Achroia grisella]
MNSSEKYNCVIQTLDGPVRGFMDDTDEQICYKFKGIPYGKPPLGSLRFLPPVPNDPWTEEIDCTQETPVPLFSCEDGKMGSEDCLYIEISTPNLKPSKPLPVIFWINSVIFSHWIIDFCDSATITNHGVVFVTCSFRIGPFGFLSFNDCTAPGNCGLKDIVLALKWVQMNISRFGGDPENITLCGSNSGGSIVHLMMLSPMAKGLFHKAIIQSASALNNWSLSLNPSLTATELCQQLGITKIERHEIIEELRCLPAHDIINAFNNLNCRLNDTPHNDIFDAVFKPCIEDEFEGQAAFLTRTPLIIIKSGNFNKVPFIIGSNNTEASILDHIKWDYYKSNLEKLQENAGFLVPRSLCVEESKSKLVGEQILKFYLGDFESLTEKTKKQYHQIMSDYYFLYYLNKTVRLHSEYSPEFPIFYYILNCTGEWEVPEKLEILNLSGHFTELGFIFQIKFDSKKCKGSRDSQITRSRMVKMWTNFAKHGNPTPDQDDPLLQVTWDPVENKDQLHYINIGTDITKGRNPFYERMSFWDKFYKDNVFLKANAYFNGMGIAW